MRCSGVNSSPKTAANPWSDALKAAVRGELLQLFEKVTSNGVVPAQAAIQERPRS